MCGNAQASEGLRSVRKDVSFVVPRAALLQRLICQSGESGEHIYTHWLGLHADVCIRRNTTNERKLCPVIIIGVQSFCTPCDAGLRARDRWSTHCGWGASCTTCQFSWCWSPCVWKGLQSRGRALQLAARLAAQRCGRPLWLLAQRCLLWRAPCGPTPHARPADL